MYRPGALVAIGIVVLSGVLLARCSRDQGSGEHHAKLAVLRREVSGLRASVAKLKRGEPVLPEDAVVVSIAESVVKQFLTAQLPFSIDVESYTIDLKEATANFTGSPSVALQGAIVHKDYPDYVGEVRAIGALDSMKVDSTSGTLRARVAVDHVDLLKMGGLENILGGDTLDELARRVRMQLAGKIPEVQIPVKIEQSIDLPSITQGPVRVQGASMPLAVSVADVFAGQGNLWIALRVTPGELVKVKGGGAR
jgi:hypothetical protein